MSRAQRSHELKDPELLASRAAAYTRKHSVFLPAEGPESISMFGFKHRHSE